MNKEKANNTFNRKERCKHMVSQWNFWWNRFFIEQLLCATWWIQGWVKFTQSSLTLCDPRDYTIHGILQARILEWVAVPFSRGSSHPMDQTQVSHIAGRFFTSWTTKEARRYLMYFIGLIYLLPIRIQWDMLQALNHVT